MSKASDNIFPKVIEAMQTTDPAAPSDSSWKIYAKAPGIYARSSNAIVGPFSAGGSMTNPMTTKGDVIIADTGGTPTRLAAGATAGMVLRSAGSGAFETWALPPGYEFDYAQVTTGVAITATTEGTANTAVTGAAVTYDGSTVIFIHFFCPDAEPDNAGAARFIQIWLYDNGSSIGSWAILMTPAANDMRVPVNCFWRITPSNAAHTYSIRASCSNGSNAQFRAGAGGATNEAPMFMRITKAA